MVPPLGFVAGRGTADDAFDHFVHSDNHRSIVRKPDRLATLRIDGLTGDFQFFGLPRYDIEHFFPIDGAPSPHDQVDIETSTTSRIAERDELELVNVGHRDVQLGLSKQRVGSINHRLCQFLGRQIARANEHREARLGRKIRGDQRRRYGRLSYLCIDDPEANR